MNASEVNRQFDDYPRECVELIRGAHMEEQGRRHPIATPTNRQQHRDTAATD